MQKLKKVAAVAVMVGGLGLVGGGVASAQGGHNYDGDFPSAVNNLQVVDCDQDFSPTTFTPAVGPVTGDNSQHIGNFCTVIGSVED